MRAPVLIVSIGAAALVRPHASTPSARDVLLASAEAMGGLERLRAIRAVRIEETGQEYLISTVTRRDAPPRAIAQTVVTVRARADSALRRKLTQTFVTRAGSFASTSVVSRGAAAAVRGSALVPSTAFELATGNEELALSPERVLITALAATDARLERDTILGGVLHHVVSLGWDGARVRLFIDAASALPTHVELVRAYPTNLFWAMWGDLRFVTTWSAWALETSGVWFPRQRSVTMNGEPFREYVATSVVIDTVAVPDSMAIPDTVRAAFAARADSERAAVTAAALPRLTPVVLADGVVLYQGGYQSAAVRQRDGVIVVEAPESNAKSRAVLADLATRWPGVRVKAVVSTSPMWMHVGGLREYAARSIPIYTLDVNVPTVRAFLVAPHQQMPDSLARRKVSPEVRAVRGLTTLGSGDERIELRPARGQHSSSMVLVWMPGRRLLYASDVVVPEAFEPVFASAYRAELRRLVRREGLDVERVFGEHLPATPWRDGVI